MTKPAVVLIGADKGGVGKTTVARTLLDFLAQHQIRTRAFDTEMPRGTLKRFHPDTTRCGYSILSIPPMQPLV
jgi:2-phosphoglycerate kinase